MIKWKLSKILRIAHNHVEPGYAGTLSPHAERLKLTLEMIRESTPALFQGPPEVVARRFELLRRQNDERNRRMLEVIARAGKKPEDPAPHEHKADSAEATSIADNA